MNLILYSYFIFILIWRIFYAQHTIHDGFTWYFTKTANSVARFKTHTIHWDITIGEIVDFPHLPIRKIKLNIANDTIEVTPYKIPLEDILLKFKIYYWAK